MRQFILGGKLAYPAANTKPEALTNGQIGVFYPKNGVATLTTTGEEVTTVANIILGRTADNGGNVLFPIYKNGFTWTKGLYQAATTFVGKVVIPEPTDVGPYTIIIVKKGIGFNERSNFTADYYVKDTDMTAADLATALAKQINNNTIASGVKATVSSNTITITATEKGVDYNIVCAECLMGVTPTITTAGAKAYGDAAYITELANKAAADAGFNYTYDESVKLYPNYPLNPLKQSDAVDIGFTIFTIRFGELREMGTMQETVYQIVQIALPTGSGAITTLENIFKKLAGETAA